MAETDKYCKICLQEMRNSGEKEEELCSICNENPVLPGRDVCLMCLREMNEAGNDAIHSEDGEDPDATDTLNSVSSVSNMDEILPIEDDDTDVGGDFEDSDALSLERVREDEERDENDNDEDELDER